MGEGELKGRSPSLGMTTIRLIIFSSFSNRFAVICDCHRFKSQWFCINPNTDLMSRLAYLNECLRHMSLRTSHLFELLEVNVKIYIFLFKSHLN